MELTILLLSLGILVTGVLYFYVLKSDEGGVVRDKPSTEKQDILKAAAATNLVATANTVYTAVAATNLVATANTVDSQIAEEVDNCYWSEWSEWNNDCTTPHEIGTPQSGKKYRKRTMLGTCQVGMGSVEYEYLPCAPPAEPATHASQMIIAQGQSAYAYGGVDGCPAGYRTLIEGECDPSSIQIKGAKWHSKRRNENDTRYPKGCYSLESGDPYPIYWNSATTSTANERGWDGFWDVVRRVCKKS